jgi:hypothetical protein
MSWKFWESREPDEIIVKDKSFLSSTISVGNNWVKIGSSGQKAIIKQEGSFTGGSSISLID